MIRPSRSATLLLCVAAPAMAMAMGGPTVAPPPTGRPDAEHGCGGA